MYYSSRQGRRARKRKTRCRSIPASESKTSRDSCDSVINGAKKPSPTSREKSVEKNDTRDYETVNDANHDCDGISVEDSMDDQQGTEDVEIFLHAKKLPGEINGKEFLKIVSVFQVSSLFKTVELTRQFFMQQTLLGTKCEAQIIQFGLYTKGSFRPLPPSKLSQYGMVALTGADNNILVSNTVESNKLYLKIQPREEKVVVAPKYNNKSYFTLREGTGSFKGRYSLMVNYLTGRALRYDETIQEVVVSPYERSLSFYFLFISPSSKTQPYLFVHH